MRTSNRPAVLAALSASSAWRVEIRSRSGIYTGNVPGDSHDDSYCPECCALLIRRWGFEVLQNRLRSGCCPDCERAIAGRWAGQ